MGSRTILASECWILARFVLLCFASHYGSGESEVRYILLVAAILAVVPVASVVAQDASELAKQIVNDPGAPDVSGAKASLVTDPNVQGGKALRIQVPRKGSNPWDLSLGGAIKKPIAKGDRLLLLFSARLEKGENGATSATLPYNAI